MFASPGYLRVGSILCGHKGFTHLVLHAFDSHSSSVTFLASLRVASLNSITLPQTPAGRNDCFGNLLAPRGRYELSQRRALSIFAA
jgi:hypothetical protein